MTVFCLNNKVDKNLVGHGDSNAVVEAVELFLRQRLDDVGTAEYAHDLRHPPRRRRQTVLAAEMDVKQTAVSSDYWRLKLGHITQWHNG